MEKSVVSLDRPVSIGGLTIVPVVKVSMSYSFAAGISVMSSKQPIAAVLISPSGTRVFKIGGEELTVGQLVGEFPALEGALAEVQKISGHLV